MATCRWHSCKKDAGSLGYCSEHTKQSIHETRVPDRRVMISGGAIHGTAKLSFRRETLGSPSGPRYTQCVLIARDGLGEEQRFLMSQDVAIELMREIETETRAK